MGKIKIVDKMPDFIVENAEAMDRSLNRMAIDITRLSKERVPFMHGQLRASGHFESYGLMKYKVIYNKEYAAFQEWGGDGVRVVRRYSKPGTGPFYLKSSGDDITAKAINYIKSEVGNIRV